MRKVKNHLRRYFDMLFESSLLEDSLYLLTTYFIYYHQTTIIFFQAREAYLRRYNLKENYDDTFTSVLGLHFDVAKYHFIQGEMILKCTSSLLSVYWQSSEVRISLHIYIFTRPHCSN